MPSSTIRCRDMLFAIWTALVAFMAVVLPVSLTSAQELDLQWAIQEAMKNNHEILMAQSRVAAAGYRIPQAKSLPDPMVTIGYQNMGLSRYNYGQDVFSYWMFSASQMFPFPGKRGLKGAMATADADGQKAALEALRLNVITTVKELYFDLFLAHKNIEILEDRRILFSRIEDAALSRYATGMGPQQEVVMAQTEKYMLLEREEMLRQKIQALEAMLNLNIGRQADAPLGKPVPLNSTKTDYTLAGLIERAYGASPEIKVRERMIAAAEAKVNMARREYYPDMTLNAGLNQTGNGFDNMYFLTATINVPIYLKTKQEPAVQEATASLSEAKHDREAVKLMMASSLKDNYSMMKATEKLMELYNNALIPKASQDYELALSGYVTGKIEALTVITRLKTFLDVELLYWNQFVEREKAIAKIEAVTGRMDETGGMTK